MAIKVIDVYKNYVQGSNSIQVLKGLNFELENGCTTAIVGKSGSGKSTFISLLAGLDRSDQGSILVEQEDLSKMSENQLTSFRAKNIGIIFQQFHLIESLTAIENVILPLEIIGEKNGTQKAKDLLDQMELSHRLKHFPRELSGGEKQRVAMARALITSPKFLLADEPSGNIDVETGKHVMDLLFNIVDLKKITLILVTHDLQLSNRCQQIYSLSSGQLHPKTGLES